MRKRSYLVLLSLAAAMLPWCGVAADAVNGLLPFSESEVRAILRHGPWPMPWRPDPSNRGSGKQEAIELGERLFFERRLSANGTVSCATCHMPERSWTDGLPRGVALAGVDRNTPHMMNTWLNRWFGWDGTADSLWSQNIRPMLDARELGSSTRQVAALLRADADLSCRYRKSFGAPPPADDDEGVTVGAAKAMAAFQETLPSGRTPFDQFRDALERGDTQAAARYPEAAQRGLKLFIGKGACNVCHLGPNFTNGEFT